MPAPPHSTLPYHLVEQTLTHPLQNCFICFLYELFCQADIDRLIADYRIGTSKHWPGATVFWQIDAHGKVRTGKIMLYDVATCKRVKYPYNHIAWVHNLLRSGIEVLVPTDATHHPSPTSDYNLKQCLFGEHLLNKYPHHTVAIVESEKTAILAAGYLPEYLWLAAGSLQGLTIDKCRVLKGRNVMLFPDLDATAKWQDKANLLNAKIPSANFTVSQYLQTNVIPELRYPGMDLGDFFIDDHFRCVAFEREWGLRE